VMGLPEYRFAAKPMGKPIRWQVSDREVALLRAGETIEAPMDLIALAAFDPIKTIASRVAPMNTSISLRES
jgi:hypothetical protein